MADSSVLFQNRGSQQAQILNWQEFDPWPMKVRFKNRRTQVPSAYIFHAFRPVTWLNK